jgi:synaptojanin
MDHSNATRGPPGSSPERSCELYIRDHPHRSIAIVSPSHALILRYSEAATEAASNNSSHSHLPLPRGRGNNGETANAKCMVEFTTVSDELLRDYRRLTPQPVYGTLGLIAVDDEVFLSVITHANKVAIVRPGETVERIQAVAFYCLSSANYDDVVPLEGPDSDPHVPRPSFDSFGDARTLHDNASIYSQSTYGQGAAISGQYGQGLGRRDVPMEHPCHELRKLLSNGSFYYSTDFDLTNRAQDRYSLTTFISTSTC